MSPAPAVKTTYLAEGPPPASERGATYPLRLAFTLTSASAFLFDGLRHRGENGRIPCHAHLFRLGKPGDNAMRVHVFIHADPASLLVRDLCEHPAAALLKTLPGLRRELPAVTVMGAVELRLHDPDVTEPDVAPMADHAARLRRYLGPASAA